MKKLLTILMLAVCLAALLAVTAGAKGGNLEKDTDGYYKIEDYDDLLAFAGLVNGGQNDANAKLMKEINASASASGKKWTPIGKSGMLYTGTFDGQGYSITGLTFNDDSKDNVGLVSEVYGTVKNVILTGSSITGYEYVGGIAGYVGGSGRVENCAFNGSVSGDWYVGGVVGNNNGSVENCYSAGSVSGDGKYLGGVAGFNSGTLKNCYYDRDLCTIAGAASDNNWNAIGDGTSSENATGLATAEMTGEAAKTYMKGFDFVNVWALTNSYPVLRVPKTEEEKTLQQDTDGYYKIEDYDDLLAFANLVNGGKNNANAKLMNGFDASASASGKNWTPIGNGENSYGGTFDGQGCCITGLTFNKSQNYAGLFGYVSGGTVKNVTLTGGSITGKDYVGGIAGYMGSKGRVENCAFGGQVSGKTHVGGVVGHIFSGGSVKNCYNTGKVSCSDLLAGGVVGVNDYGSVENCYSAGSVGGGSYFGGVAGFNSGTLKNCYYDKEAASNVTGIIGYTEYSTGTVENVTGLNTVQMTGEAAKTNMTGFDFDTVWKTTESYPVLRGTDEPAFELKVKDTNDTTGETSDWQDTADYDIGDAVPFKITVKLGSDVSKFKEYDLDVCFSPSSSFSSPSVESVMLGEDALSQSDYSVSNAGGLFTVSLSLPGGDDSLNNAEIAVYLNAKLNESAGSGKAGNPASAYVKYPLLLDQSARIHSAPDWVNVFTHRLEIKAAGFSGLTFKLEKYVRGPETDTQEEISSTSLSGNTAVFHGIDDGIYKLTLSDGSKAIGSFTFTVTAGHNEVCSAENDLGTLLTSLSAALNGEGDLTFAVNDDLSVLTVSYKPSVYTVTFNGSGGTTSDGKAETTQTVPAGQATALDANPFTREGFAFDGWNTGQNPTETNPGTFYGDKASVTLSDNLTLYAQWKANDFTVSITNPASYTYDGTDKTPSVTVKDGPQDLTEAADYTVTLEKKDASGQYAAANEAKDAGDYKLTVTGKGDYAHATQSGKEFTIQKAGATVKAKPVNLTYGDPIPTSFEAEESGVITGDTLKYTLSCDTKDGAVGDYPITVILGENPNYTVTATDGVLTIGKKSLSITANSADFTYNGTAQSDPGFTVDGLVGNDAVEAVVSGSITFPSEQTVKNQITSYTFTSGSEANYTVTAVDGTLTMNKAAVGITITAASREWVYDGQTHADSTVTLTGNLFPGDELTAEAEGSVKDVKDTADGNNPVKAGYTVKHGTEDVTENYIITPAAGKLEITPKPVTVTADNAEKTVGREDPAFTAKVEGLAENDTFEISYSFQRPGVGTDAGEKVGDYPINVTGEKIQGNYEVSFVPGTLTIKAADKTELNNAIKEAEDLYNQIKDQYPEIAEELKKIIDEAKEDAADQNATENVVEYLKEVIADAVTKAENKEDFEEYKEDALDTVESLKKDGDSKEVSELIADAEKAVEDLRYDEKKTPAENKEAVDKILSDLKDALSDQRGGEKEDFGNYKEEAKETADRLLWPNDTPVSIGLVTDAKEEIDELEYDEDLTPAENREAVEAILEELIEDLFDQREKEALEEAERNRRRFESIRIVRDMQKRIEQSKPAPEPPVKEKEDALPFTDVSENDPFYSDILHVYENGIMNGTSSTEFTPFGTLTRGMIVTILYRMEGEPAAIYSAAFSDVPAGEWYTPGVEWAAANKIVLGFGDGTYGPSKPVTREQLAAILYRYAEFKEYPLDPAALISFASGDVSPWAAEYAAWALTNRILPQDETGSVRGTSPALRWEVAAAVKAFLEVYD